MLERHFSVSSCWKRRNRQLQERLPKRQRNRSRRPESRKEKLSKIPRSRERMLGQIPSSSRSKQRMLMHPTLLRHSQLLIAVRYQTARMLSHEVAATMWTTP